MYIGKHNFRKSGVLKGRMKLYIGSAINNGRFVIQSWLSAEFQNYL